jgi:hypothetical protein
MAEIDVVKMTPQSFHTASVDKRPSASEVQSTVADRPGADTKEAELTFLKAVVAPTDIESLVARDPIALQRSWTMLAGARVRPARWQMLRRENPESGRSHGSSLVRRARRG